MIEFRASKDILYGDWVRLVALQRDGFGKIAAVAEPVKFTLSKCEPGQAIQYPTLELDEQSALSLMNALWHAGVRPSDFKSPNGEINRLEAHLADMRRLVFDAHPQSEGTR